MAEKKDSYKNSLLLLSEELTKKTLNQKKITVLLKKVGIPFCHDPFIITNEVLKRLHDYEVIESPQIKEPQRHKVL